MQRSTSSAAFDHRTVVTALFLSFYFVYLLWYIDPPVIFTANGFSIPSYIQYLHDADKAPAKAREPDRYSGDGHILELTAHALTSRLTVPGGTAHFLVTLAIYSCAHPVTGGVVMTGIAWLLAVFVSRCFSRYGRRIPLSVALAPSIGILLAVHRLDSGFLDAVVPVIGVMALYAPFQRIAGHRAVLRPLTFTALFWLAWYLFQWAAFLFLALAAIDAAFRRARPLTIAAVAAVNALLLVCVETMVIPPEYTIRFDRLLEGSTLLLPIYMLLVAAFAAFWPGRPVAGLPAVLRSRRIHDTADAMFVVFLTAVTIAWARHDPLVRDIRAMALTAHHEQQNQWEKILSSDFSWQFRRFPRICGPLQKYLTHARIRSLAHTGRLGTEMFSYPQATFSAEPLLLRQSIMDFGFPQWVSAADVFMELGLVNYAEKTLGELMECMGPYPFLMYRRSLLHLANNNPQTAGVYLSRLRGMPPFGSEARHLLGILHDSSALAAEPAVAHLRSCMDTADYFFLAADEEELLRRLLERNPKNKLAFDYLMAAHLLNGNVEKVVERLAETRALGYTTLPRHWEEALCVYLTREEHDAPGGGEDLMRMVSPATFQRFDQFMQMYFPLEGSPDAATKLGPLFGSTYYYFYTFESSYGARR